MTTHTSTTLPVNSSPVLQSLELFDPDALSESVRSSSFEHVQLEHGCFHAQLKHIDLGSLKIDSGRYTRKVIARGEFPSSTVILGCVLDSREEGSINGYRFRQNDVVIFPDGAELDYILPAATTWCAVQLPVKRLAEIGFTELILNRIKVLPGNLYLAQLMSRLANTQISNFSAGVAKPSPLHPFTDEILLDQITQVLNRYSSEDSITRRPSLHNRMAVIRRFERKVRERIDTVLRIPELCAELRVTNRVLEYLFKEEIGMTPKQYSNLLRLHAARQELIRRNAESLTIKQIAQCYGISHLGRFAAAYLRQFGELPSDTLRR
jgi:AraC family ethanolamine operon transcriptional activator